MKINSLKYPPLKKIPENLIYHKIKGSNSADIPDLFIMFSTKEKNMSKLYCYKTTINKDGKNNVPSLYISLLFSNPQQCGLGTKMLNFAQTFSKKIGCEGNFHLISNSGMFPNKIPHIFYRKYGMNTEDALTNAKLDRFIRRKKDATYKDFPNIKMYYPPVEEKNKNNWKVFLTKLFTKLGI